MTFEWDEDKRERNLARHRIDFVDAVVVFDDRPVITNYSPREGEDRWATTIKDVDHVEKYGSPDHLAQPS